MYLLEGDYESVKDRAEHRVKSKLSDDSHTSSDEEFALPPPHSSTSSSDVKVSFILSMFKHTIYNTLHLHT